MSPIGIAPKSDTRGTSPKITWCTSSRPRATVGRYDTRDHAIYQDETCMMLPSSYSQFSANEVYQQQQKSDQSKSARPDEQFACSRPPTKLLQQMQRCTTSKFFRL